MTSVTARPPEKEAALFFCCFKGKYEFLTNFTMEKQNCAVKIDAKKVGRDENKRNFALDSGG